MTKPTVRRPLRLERHTSAVERVEAARDKREQLRGDELEQLRDEARYRRERLELYKARLYAGRARRQDKLRELQRASDGAAARVRRAEAQDSAHRPPA